MILVGHLILPTLPGKISYRQVRSFSTSVIRQNKDREIIQLNNEDELSSGANNENP